MKTALDIQKLEIKVLSDSDLDEIIRIQEEAFSVMENSATLRRNTKETFAVCFDEPSIAYGVMYEGRMIAFGMLYCAGEDHENLAYSLDNTDDYDLNKVANVKVIIVRPQFRGNGLQKYLIALLEKHAIDNGYKTLLCTVSPDNQYSMNNFVQSGYEPVKTLNKYGGLARVLLIKSC